jgi:hypothetical protein
MAAWRLFGLFVAVILVVAALRSVLAVVTELGQLLVKRLDGGFLLAKDFLDQLVAVGFERLLLGEEFIDRIVGHVDYDPIRDVQPGCVARLFSADLHLPQIQNADAPLGAAKRLDFALDLNGPADKGGEVVAIVVQEQAG